MDEITLLAVVGLLGGAIGFLLGLFVGNLRPSGAPPASRGASGRNQRRLDARMQAAAPSLAKKARDDHPSTASLAQAVLQPSAALPSQPGEPKTQQPNMSPVLVFARALQADIKPPPPVTRSIAAQIDEILQEQLAVQPLPDGKPVRLLELPGKGMVVMVGLDQYDGVESVPNEEIRRIIRQAVAIWEARAIDQE